MPTVAASAQKGKGKKAKGKKVTKPAGPRVSLNEEELQAAVQGNLKVRKTTGSKAQDSLEATNDRGAPKGRPVGVTTGLPIFGAWCYIFQRNEKATKADRLTDPQLTDWIKKEFPGREAKVFEHIPSIRANYNQGRFTKSVVPKVQSHRYNEDGSVWERGQGKPEKEKKAKAAKGKGKKATTPAGKKPRKLSPEEAALANAA